MQVYVQSPYTDYDKQNGVEKSAVSLVGFGKTGMIEPGASETLSMTVNKRDIASYDTYGAGTYILDAGDYYFTAATDAHNAVNNILAAKGYTVESTNGKMTADGNADLTYTWTEDASTPPPMPPAKTAPPSPTSFPALTPTCTRALRKP